MGVQSSMTVWEPGKQPLPAKSRGKMGQPPRLLKRSADHQYVSVKQLAMSLPSHDFKESLGVKAQIANYNLALPPFAYVPLIGTMKERNLTQKNGC